MSIYQRIKASKILLRILANLVFYLISRSIKHTKHNATRSPSTNTKSLVIVRFAFQMCVKFIVNMDYINIADNILVMATSLQTKVSLIEFLIILFDMGSMLYFTSILTKLYLGTKGKRTVQVKCELEREILLSAFYQQNGSKIVLPYSLAKNLMQVLRVLTLFLLIRYQRTFGLAFASINIGCMVFILCYFKRNNQFHIWSFSLFMVSELFQTTLFIGIGFYCMFSDSLRYSSTFINFIIALTVSWLGLSLFVMLIQLILNDHRNLYKKYRSQE